MYTRHNGMARKEHELELALRKLSLIYIVRITLFILLGYGVTEGIRHYRCNAYSGRRLVL